MHYNFLVSEGLQGIQMNALKPIQFKIDGIDP